MVAKVAGSIYLREIDYIRWPTFLPQTTVVGIVGGTPLSMTPSSL